ncbi:MAG: tRNA (adenosine(37)-N6)-dimethylallyltransferase MiaA, partial [Lacinutrix venerupis]
KHFTVATEDVYQLHNTSAVIRSCDVFGIQEVHIVEEVNSKRIDREIAMGAQKWVDLKRHHHVKDAIKTLDNLFKKHDIVIMVGGSGLYVDAVTKGLDYFPEIDKSIREKLNLELAENGLQKLQLQLKTLDLKAYNTIAIDNPQRVIRALEICLGSGKPYSSFLNKDKNKRIFKTITIGLTAERETIYNRINKRVDIMMSQGQLEEVKSLINKQHLNALNTVGYKEFFNYFNGEWTLDFAIQELKKNTRRFAKRQLTWFKRDPNTLWFDYKTSIDNIISSIKSKL